jgi:photosystem II stability/assembly factor-like uncharacterized protein
VRRRRRAATARAGALAVAALAVLLIPAVAHADWQRQSSPSARRYTGVVFADALRGWATNADGTLAVTTDGGAHWRACYPVPGEILRDVAYVPPSHVWIVGNMGTIVVSHDSGLTWQTQRSGTCYGLFSAHFASDALHGWTVGNGGRILRTTDGGTTWEHQVSGTDVLLYGVTCTGPDTACAVGDNGLILRTTDGGATWKQAPSATDKELNAVCFAGADDGWAVGSFGTVVHTTDGGASWVAQSSGTDRAFEDVAFLADARTGWAVGNGGTIVHTADGGLSWEQQPSYAGTYLYGVCFADGLNGWAVGWTGTILHTTDGGLPDVTAPVTYAPRAARVSQGGSAHLGFRVFDPDDGEVRVTVKVRSPSGRLKRTLDAGLRPTGIYQSCPYPRVALAPGTYRFTVFAVDHAGNRQSRAGTNRLTVR